MRLFFIGAFVALLLNTTLAQKSGGVGELPNDVFSSETVTVNGIEMHYVIGGEGDPVVLVHGWPQTWREWEEIMPTLAEDYTVIVPDLRGAGESEIAESGYDKRRRGHDLSKHRSLGARNASRGSARAPTHLSKYQ